MALGKSDGISNNYDKQKADWCIVPLLIWLHRRCSLFFLKTMVAIFGMLMSFISAGTKTWYENGQWWKALHWHDSWVRGTCIGDALSLFSLPLLYQCGFNVWRNVFWLDMNVHLLPDPFGRTHIRTQMGRSRRQRSVLRCITRPIRRRWALHWREMYRRRWGECLDAYLVRAPRYTLKYTL